MKRLIINCLLHSFAFILLATSSSSLIANEHQETEFKKAEKLIEKILSKFHQNHAFDGVALIAKNGKIVVHQAYGYADREKQIKMSVNHQFPIASLSKSITATLTLKLEQQGKLKLSDVITQYLPELSEKKFGQITIGQLLTHYSGLADHFEIEGWFDPSFHQNTSPDDFIKVINQLPIKFQPSKRYHYSNLGYFLLGKIIERIMQQDYASTLEREVTSVAKMKDTGLLADYQRPSRLVSGYIWGLNGGYLKQQPQNMSLFGAGAGIYSTALDLFRFEQMLYESTILDADSRSNMFDRASPIGWRMLSVLTDNDLKKTASQYDGKIDGFSSILTRYMDDRHSIILLSNNGTSYALKRQISDEIAKILIDKKQLITPPTESLKLHKSIVDGQFEAQLETLKNKIDIDTVEEDRLISVGLTLLWSNRPEASLKTFTVLKSLFPKSLRVENGLEAICQHRLTDAVVKKEQYCRL